MCIAVPWPHPGWCRNEWSAVCARTPRGLSTDYICIYIYILICQGPRMSQAFSGLPGLRGLQGTYFKLRSSSINIHHWSWKLPVIFLPIVRAVRTYDQLWWTILMICIYIYNFLTYLNLMSCKCLYEFLWVSLPELFQEGWTWLFDNCGGHGDTYGHYHYHAPPLCLLKSLGLPVPKNSSWWKFEGEKAWPESGPEVQVGWVPWSVFVEALSGASQT